VVDPGVRLAANVTVGPLSYVEAGAEIGAGTVIGPNVTILAFTSVGENCRVHAGAVLGDLPQDVAFEGAESYVWIGDECVIRECVTVHRGTEEGSATTVGAGSMLMATSHVAHNCTLGNGVIMANAVLLGGRVEIGDLVFLGGGAAVHQFVRIGRLAMISGGSGAKRDVPPFMMTRELSTGIMGLNLVGLRRAGIVSEERLQLKRALKLLYHSGLNVTQAVERMESELEGECVGELCEFLKSSRRGVSTWSGA